MHVQAATFVDLQRAQVLKIGVNAPNPFDQQANTASDVDEAVAAAGEKSPPETAVSFVPCDVRGRIAVGVSRRTGREVHYQIRRQLSGRRADVPHTWLLEGQGHYPVGAGTRRHGF
jgi:hypothetical protein